MRERERYLMWIGKYQESADVGHEAIKKLPRDRDVVVYLGYDLLHLERYDELLELTRIDALSANGDLQYYQFCKQKLAELKEEEIHPKPLLGGRDLIAMGLTPGPSFHEILKQVEEAQLGGELSSREEAMEWVSKHYGNRG